MQWICKRCGLQRDDRRGSGCNGVKGQAHDWIETEVYERQQRQKKLEYERQQRQKKLENWINSEDSLEWKKEYENIQIFFKEESIKIQQKYTPLLEESKDKYAKLLEEDKKKYDIFVEYTKKLLENGENIIKEANKKEEEMRKEHIKKGSRRFMVFIIIMIISFIIINIFSNLFFSILTGIIIFILGFKISFRKFTFNNNKYAEQALYEFLESYFNNFNDNEKKELFDFLNKLRDNNLEDVFKDKDELEKLEVAWTIYMNNVEKEKDSYLKKILMDYRNDIKNTLQKGIQMMQESNKKHGVDENYYYDNFYFNFKPIDLIKYPTLYDDDIKEIRKKYIGDSDFLKDYK